MDELAFAHMGEAEYPVQGTVVFLGVDTVDVRVGAAILRNVAIAKPLTVENVERYDVVSLGWFKDITPPPAPTNVRIVQGRFGAHLAWDWHGKPEDDLAFFEVDARRVGGAWGEDVYPVSEGTRQVHYSRIPHEPIQCRVRAEDRRGNRSGWVVCEDTLVDGAYRLLCEQRDWRGAMYVDKPAAWLCP